MDGLHRTVALAVLCKGRLLSGDEIRFLRKTAGLTATALANSLAVTKNAVSKWENGGKIGRASDRAIRCTCGMGIIADIVNQQTGDVDPEDVNRTVETLQRFFVRFTPQCVLAGVRDEVGESEKLMIDPSMPFNFSLLTTPTSRPVPTAAVQ
jgi:DNA-binding XRE family transcriptional regulator